MIIHDRATFWRLVSNPDLNFGDAYSDGRLEVEGDLLEFLELVYRAEDAQPRSGLAALANRLRVQKINTLGRAAPNIHHHYDIGDDFYRLWLDREMVYTCAYFPTPEATLEEAQMAKMDLVCRKLWLQPGETVVEAGCGWGALALHMARHYGVTVKAYNVSREQIRTARERAKAEGLRRIAWSSSTTITAPSAASSTSLRRSACWSTSACEITSCLGGVIDRCLRPGGRGMVHSIGRDEAGALNAWIETADFSRRPTCRACGR